MRAREPGSGTFGTEGWKKVPLMLSLPQDIVQWAFTLRSVVETSMPSAETSNETMR